MLAIRITINLMSESCPCLRARMARMLMTVAIHVLILSASMNVNVYGEMVCMASGERTGAIHQGRLAFVTFFDLAY